MIISPHLPTPTCRYLVNVGCVKPLCDLLTVQDPRMVMITLEGLENILKIGQQDNVKNVNPFALMVEEAYGVLCVWVCGCRWTK